MDLNHQLLASFQEVIKPLDCSHLLKGDVLLSGTGGFIPERSLVCQPKIFTTLRRNVNSVVCCDPNFDPSVRRFSQPAISIPYREGTRIQSRKIYWFGSDIHYLIDSLDRESFDAATAFQFVDMQDQLRTSIGSDFFRLLKPGGLLIGSGSADSEQEIAKIGKRQGFTIERTATLMQRLLPFAPHHIGFILRKPTI